MGKQRQVTLLTSLTCGGFFAAGRAQPSNYIWFIFAKEVLKIAEFLTPSNTITAAAAPSEAEISR